MVYTWYNLLLKIFKYRYPNILLVIAEIQNIHMTMMTFMTYVMDMTTPETLK